MIAINITIKLIIFAEKSVPFKISLLMFLI